MNNADTYAHYSNNNLVKQCYQYLTTYLFKRFKQCLHGHINKTESQYQSLHLIKTFKQTMKLQLYNSDFTLIFLSKIFIIMIIINVITLLYQCPLHVNNTRFLNLFKPLINISLIIILKCTYSLCCVFVYLYGELFLCFCLVWYRVFPEWIFNDNQYY